MPDQSPLDALIASTDAAPASASPLDSLISQTSSPADDLIADSKSIDSSVSSLEDIPSISNRIGRKLATPLSSLK